LENDSFWRMVIWSTNMVSFKIFANIRTIFSYSKHFFVKLQICDFFNVTCKFPELVLPQSLAAPTFSGRFHSESRYITYLYLLKTHLLLEKSSSF
jgi:hypothetical protein